MIKPRTSSPLSVCAAYPCRGGVTSAAAPTQAVAAASPAAIRGVCILSPACQHRPSQP